MDYESKSVGRFIEAVALNNKKFVKLAEHLRSHFNTLSVTQDIYFQQYESQTAVELYVDAELRNGKAICWSLEINWSEEQWILESCVLVNHDQGQDKLKDFPNKSPKTLDELIVQFNNSADELIDSFSEINIAA